MLDTIYITDEYLAKPKPIGFDSSTQNFTMPGRDNITPSAIPAFAVTPLAMSVLPGSLIFSAISAMPSLASIFNSDNDEDKAARAEKERLLAAFVERATFSPAQAKAIGCRFQPGHPMAGKSYRRHPLADLADGGSEHLYIPSDNYDAYVLEERESELMRLLISLGATRISITKNTSNTSSSRQKAAAAVDAGPIASGTAGYENNSEKKNGSLDTRVFSLNGRGWNATEKLKRNGFLWLDFEPSWKAVLFAREHGGCTEATIELKESTSFSEDKNLDISINAYQKGGGASAKLEASAYEERTHVIAVQFSPAP